MRRSELPAEIQDASNWPRVDTSGFSQTMLDQYLAKERAVIDWLNGKSLRSVEARTGINRGTVQRAIERCLAPHTDGTIQGFRGLIAHARTRPYRRTAESSRPISNQSPGIGLSGALGQLFERLPTLESIVDRAISKGAVGVS
jgi:putative transposase